MALWFWRWALVCEGFAGRGRPGGHRQERLARKQAHTTAQQAHKYKTVCKHTGTYMCMYQMLVRACAALALQRIAAHLPPPARTPSPHHNKSPAVAARPVHTLPSSLTSRHAAPKLHSSATLILSRPAGHKADGGDGRESKGGPAGRSCFSNCTLSGLELADLLGGYVNEL